MKFSEKLKYYRKKNNLTQKSLSKILNVSDKTISSWENDRTFPDMYMLRKIVTIFKISMDDLLVNDEFVDKNNYFFKKFGSFIRYKNTIIICNIILIFISYIELIGIFNFHFPIVNLLSLVFIFLSIVFVELTGVKILVSRNFMFLIISILLNLMLSYLGNSFISIIKGQSEMYVKGIFLGRFILILILSFMILISKIMITSHNNKK
ncbi:helix-turn-helix transcriptional regulator [Apilactobacillus xinyiensis]|uniref:helix-turn-helix transcriptional regulator n=1 Tax=Apilactobacillus xinyiensis TaxID=2841032 RepID=UPI00200C5228|nr:helix-turn-helix transcriptional regulator [Apilactobacillus xinyiensis]MCL0330807.1 helix-turn-helix domain-containing protein [Apilactobacillus xinyiensis]